ncbi:MAG: hypothetical protein ACLR0U_09625 [Enterocloster clostridioformis]
MTRMQGTTEAGLTADASRGQGRKSSFDTPIQTKPSSNRQNKNAHKNARFDKRDRLRTARRKFRRQEREHLSCLSFKKEESKADEVKTITLPDVLTIKELAEKMKLPAICHCKEAVFKGSGSDPEPGNRL